MNKWILFRKDNGKIGILPETSKSMVKGVIIETVAGTFNAACDRAEELEEEDK